MRASRRTFSMSTSAAIFAWRSRFLASLAATARLSSAAAEPMVEMLRLMRSGDCTMRARVREMPSDAAFISLLTRSCGARSVAVQGAARTVG